MYRLSGIEKMQMIMLLCNKCITNYHKTPAITSEEQFIIFSTITLID